MTKRTFLLVSSFFLILAAVLFAWTKPVTAQDPQPTPSDNAVNRVAKQMFCPVCENIPLDVCPTQACHDWRELIRQKLADGWTDQQIKAYFAQQYGDRVLAEPPRTGLNWLVYILPWVAIAGGVVLVWRVLVSMRGRHGKLVSEGEDSAASTGAHAPNAAKVPGLSPDDPYLARLEDQLKHKD